MDFCPIKGKPMDRAKGMERTRLNAMLAPLNNEGDVWATISGITKAISHEQQFNTESI